MTGFPVRRMIEHVNEARSLQRKDSKFSEKLLLANALAQCAFGKIVGWRAIRTWFDDWRWLIGNCLHHAG